MRMTIRLTFKNAQEDTNVYYLYCGKDNPYNTLLQALNNFFHLIDTKQSKFIEDIDSSSLEAYLFYRRIYETAIREEDATVSYGEYFAKIYNKERAEVEE